MGLKLTKPPYSALNDTLTDLSLSLSLQVILDASIREKTITSDISICYLRHQSIYSTTEHSKKKCTFITKTTLKKKNIIKQFPQIEYKKGSEKKSLTHDRFKF